MTIQINLNNRTFNLENDIEIQEVDEGSNRLIKLNLSREDFSEGIWLVISESDAVDYENDVIDSEYTRVGVLGNEAVCGIPWGAYVPYKLNGTERPVAVFEEIIDVDNDAVYFPASVKAQYEELGIFAENEEQSE